MRHQGPLRQRWSVVSASGQDSTRGVWAQPAHLQGPPHSALCPLPSWPCPDTPQFFSRLSEQTQLVDKLTEQNSRKERTISHLETEVQNLVRGAGKSSSCVVGDKRPPH